MMQAETSDAVLNSPQRKTIADEKVRIWKTMANNTDEESTVSEKLIFHVLV